LEKYINHFYTLKQSSKNLTRSVAKLLLNSLYGKFASRTGNNKSKLYLDGNREPYLETKELMNFYDPEISLPIATAIASYGRMEIYPYINIPNNKCYYSDTDSVFLEKPLDKDKISSDIGRMKLEGIAKKAVFLNKKQYIVEYEGGVVKKAFAGIESVITKDD
jgi:DNA polymerase elongation subunit (family B)